MAEFFGKYRGKVENNVDPMQMGRIQVSVPAVLGRGSLAWAMPCVPYAGPGVGFFAIPPKGANIWVEFEGGKPDYPIWSGCFWGAGEVPAMPAIAETKVFKTDCITLTFSDMPGAGGVTLEVGSPAVTTPLKLVLDAAGIEFNSTSASGKLGPEGIELTCGAATIELSTSSISIKIAGATIELSGPSVSINNGALEVK
ncbi:MAG: phage baseplate assembly protein V [Candidatus Poribacteria bacterium]|nr:phage baseplate assembly protein V [Candidatus Poribacteria bacterium]